jgi:eukaryotic-like serine/threonine-protein kinase
VTVDPSSAQASNLSEPDAVIGPGAVLTGRYRVDRAIGRGGMAMVYRGYDQLLDRDVAIKVLGMMAANATGTREEFLREARASAALAHPNIVSVYDAGVHSGERYIVMEFVPGGSVAELIETSAPLSPHRTVEIGAQIADALDYGHQHGVIHCDVKPQNVLLDERGRPKLVDFGIARTIAATGALTETVTGTAGYIAPEQLIGEKVDGRADIYALGSVLYEMLCGDLPFDSTNLAALATQRLVRPPVPLRSRNPSVPRPLAECVMRAIEREPTDRFPTAASFSRSLSLSLTESGTPPPARPVHPHTVELSRRPTSELLVDRPQMDHQTLGSKGGRLAWPAALIVLGILIMVGAVAAVELPGLVRQGPASMVATPNVTNQTLNDAAAQLHDKRLNVSVSFEDTTAQGICEGRIMRQDPQGGAQLAAGQPVSLVVSQNDQC